MYFGTLWRAMAWGLLAGSSVGAAYGVILGLGYLGPSSGVGILTFAPGGATLGSIGGFVAGAADGVGIVVLTALRPPPPGAETKYIRQVRLTSACCTLLAAIAFFVFSSLYSLTPGGIFFFELPALIAVAVSFALGPQAVMWFMPWCDP
jgi:hypothetical protein